jgi:hypothetical protein
MPGWIARHRSLLKNGPPSRVKEKGTWSYAAKLRGVPHRREERHGVYLRWRMLGRSPRGTKQDGWVAQAYSQGYRHSGERCKKNRLGWEIRAKSASKLVAQTKGELFMLVSETADGSGIIGALRSLGESKGMNFHKFSLPEDQYVRLLLKSLGKLMPEPTSEGSWRSCTSVCSSSCSSNRSDVIRTPGKTVPSHYTS